MSCVLPPEYVSLFKLIISRVSYNFNFRKADAFNYFMYSYSSFYSTLVFLKQVVPK